MQHFSDKDIIGWNRFCRANFINCLSGYKPVSLIGTVNETGQANVAIFSNIVHIGSRLLKYPIYLKSLKTYCKFSEEQNYKFTTLNTTGFLCFYF